jgi:hypothetical protein
MASLEELAIAEMIQIKKKEISALTEMIQMKEREISEHKQRAIDLQKMRDPNMIVCTCGENKAIHGCFMCDASICEDCTGFADDQDMLYFCHGC